MARRRRDVAGRTLSASLRWLLAAVVPATVVVGLLAAGATALLVAGAAGAGPVGGGGPAAGAGPAAASVDLAVGSTELAALLLDDPGPPFRPAGGAPQPLPDIGLPSAHRTFVADGGGLDLLAYGVPDDWDLATAILVLGQLGGSGNRFPTPELGELALGIVQPPEGGDRGHQLLFAAGRAVFVFTVLSQPQATWDPEALLIELAHRQIDRAGPPAPPPDRSAPAGSPGTPGPTTASGGGAPAGPGSTVGSTAGSTGGSTGASTAAPAGSPGRRPATAGDERVADELDRVLVLEPPEPLGLVLAGAASGLEAVPSSPGLDPALVDFLDRNSTSRVRVFRDAPATMAVVVGATRYPYPVFAAAALGWFADRSHGRVDRSRAAVPGARGAIVVRAAPTAASSAGEVAVAFRRGDTLFTVLGRGLGADPAAVERAVMGLAGAQAALAPTGAGGVYRFPSTTRGLLITLLVASAAAGAAALASRLVSRPRRTGRGAGAAARRGADAPAVVSVGADATRIRRSGWSVVAAQVAALDLAVVGLVGELGPSGAPLVPAGVALGVGATAWLRRREIAAVGEPPPPFRLGRAALPGLVVGGLTLAVLGVGAAVAVAGVRAWAFGPSLSHLRRADTLGLDPQTLAVLTALAGLAVLVVGGLLSRQARRLGRIGVARLRHLDPRPPLLYLRSFGDDTLPLASVVSARRPFFELFSVRGREPFEDAVAWELASYGPVVAVGRPGASLASLGAAREHLPDATWQVEVAARMAEARALVVAIGESPGLAWEIGHVVSGGHLSRTMFLFPPLDEPALRARWSSVAAALAAAGCPPVELPAEPGSVVTAVVGPEVAVTVADRRDEASYRAAVDRSMLLLGARGGR